MITSVSPNALVNNAATMGAGHFAATVTRACSALTVLASQKPSAVQTVSGNSAATMAAEERAENVGTI